MKNETGKTEKENKNLKIAVCFLAAVVFFLSIYLTGMKAK